MGQKVKLFDRPDVRTCRREGSDEWYYSVVDVVVALTGTKEPQKYIERIKRDSPYIRRNWKAIARPMVVPDRDGVKRRILMADAVSILRLVLAIHTPQAEPYKLWACVAAYEQYDRERPTPKEVPVVPPSPVPAREDVADVVDDRTDYVQTEDLYDDFPDEALAEFFASFPPGTFDTDD